MIRRSLALLLVAGCPASDDDDSDDGAASASTTTGEASGSETGPLCGVCDGDDSCHSVIDVSGHCVCEPGHEWADPGNDDDFTCMPIPPRPGDAECTPDNHAHMEGGECYCDDGYTWCNVDDPANLSCCDDPGQGGGSTG